MVSQNVIVKDEIGFHARTASIFAKAASTFEAKISIEFGPKRINAKSMLAIMTLGVRKDDIVKIIAEGADEEKALSSLTELILLNFEL
jgi:phosphocarrier protein